MACRRIASDATLVDDSEAQPLLDPEASDGALYMPTKCTRRPTPLPKRALAAVCAMRLVEPLAFSHIFPYVNELIAGLGVPSGDVGFYSGLVVRHASIFRACYLEAEGRCSSAGELLCAG